MSKDFRSDRIRVFKIIGSGSSGTSRPGLAIYSASSAKTDYSAGERDSTMFNNVGSDVFLFVSGTNSGGSVKRGTLGASVSLFGGDVVVSGTLWAERQVIEVEEATTGSLTVSGSLMVSQSVTIKGYKKEGAGGYNHVAIHFANNDQTNGSRIVWDEAHAAIWEANERFYINASGSVLILSGGAAASNNEAIATDVAFYVSGTKGASIAGAKGVSLFGGDVTVSGSHRVRQYVEVNADKSAAHFIHFGSSAGKEMISSLSSLGQVLILSGGAPGSANEATYTDVALFVSGTKLSKGTTVKGTALFGGDLYVSGGLYLGARIYSDGDTNTSIRPQTNRWRIIANNFEHADFNSSISQKVTVFNRGKENIDFQVSSDTKGAAIFVDASTDQVLILSGGAPLSNNEATALDVNLYTSGTVGSKGTSTRGTSLFGGDVHISGSITSDGTALVNGTGAAAEIAYWTDSDTITSDNDLTFDGTTLTVNKSLIVNESGGDFDLKVKTKDRDYALYTKGVNNQVLILSGGTSGNSPNESNYTDMALFVSGAIGARGTSVKGVSLFGGDTVISGSLVAINGSNNGGTISGSIHHTEDGISYLVGGTNITISSASNGQLTLSSTGGEWTRATVPNRVYPIAAASTHVLIGGTSLGAANTILASDGGATFNEPGDSVDFRVESNTKENALLVNGSTDQVLILSGGVPTDAFNEAAGTDINFYVSGTVGSKGTSTRGTTLFGGDLAASGTIYASEYIRHDGDNNTNIRFENDRITIAAGGTDLLKVDKGENTVSINPDITSGINTIIQGPNKAGVAVDGSVDRVLILSGGAAASFNEAAAVDVSFYVSGSSGLRGTSARGTSVIGGDLVASGTFSASGSITDVHNPAAGLFFSKAHPNNIGITCADSNDLISRHADGTPDSIIINNDAAQLSFLVKTNSKMAIASKAETSTTNTVYINTDTAGEAGTDTAMWVSGSRNSKGTTTKGTSVFGGDVVISGSLYGGSPLSIGGDLVVSGAVIFSGSSETTVTGSMIVTGSMTVTGSLTVSGSDTFTVYGPSIFNEGGTADSDFRVESNNKTHAVFVDASADQVLILSGGAPASQNESSYTDINFFVSGSKGSKGTPTKGTSVFGGDIVSSGTMYVSGTIRVVDDTDSYIEFHHNHPNSARFVAGGVQIIARDAAGTPDAITINSDGAAVSALWKVNNKFAFGSKHSTNQVFINSDTATEGGADTSFWASGSIGSATTSTRGTSVFGGDVVISGSLNGGSLLQVGGYRTDLGTDVKNLFVANTGGNSVVVFDGDVLSSGSIRARNNVIADLGLSGSLTKLTNGTSYLIAGSGITIASSSNGAVTIAGTAVSAEWTDHGTILRPNDGAAENVGIGSTGTNPATYKVFLSGSGDIKTNTFVTASLGFSGSLTRLTDGTSYMVAGQNITISSASNGQVTIASSGGGSPGGSDTQVQYNNSSNFGGISGVTTNGSVMTFGDSAILVGQDITHTGDTDTKITFGTDSITLTAGNENLLTLTESTQDVVTIGDGGDVDFQVKTNGDDNTLFVQGSSDRVGIGTNAPSTILHVKESAPTVTIQRESNANNSTLQFMGQAGATATVVHMGVTNDLVMTTFDGSDQEEILRLGSHYAEDVRQVIMLSGSGMHAAAMQPKQSVDINFFVSGTVGSRGTSARGTTVFGGDVVTSGSAYIGMDSSGVRSLNVYANVSGQYAAKIDNDNSSSGHVLKLETDGNGSSSRILEMEDGDGDTLFRARADGRFGFGAAGVSSMGAGTFVVGIDGSHTADIAISKRLQHLGDSNTYMDFPAVDQIQLVAGARSMIEMIEDGDNTQVLILSGGAPASIDDARASDVAFFVSGSRTKIGTATANITGRNSGKRTNAIFGGDIVVSGSIYGTSEISAGNPGLHLQASTLQIAAQNQAAITNTAGVAPGFGSSQSTDTFFSVSGSMNSLGTAVKGTSVFGGDVVVSGSLRGRQLHITTHKFTPGNDARAYVRFDSSGSDGSPDANNKMVTPYSGRLVKVIARSTANSPVAGNTTIGLHFGANGSTNVSTSYQGTSQTVNMAARDTAYTFNFTLAENWAGGDIVGLSMDPTETPGDVILTAVWEFETY